MRKIRQNNVFQLKTISRKFVFFNHSIKCISNFLFLYFLLGDRYKYSILQKIRNKSINFSLIMGIKGFITLFCLFMALMLVQSEIQESKSSSSGSFVSFESSDRIKRELTADKPVIKYSRRHPPSTRRPSQMDRV